MDKNEKLLNKVKLKHINRLSYENDLSEVCANISATDLTDVDRFLQKRLNDTIRECTDKTSLELTIKNKLSSLKTAFDNLETALLNNESEKVIKEYDFISALSIDISSDLSDLYAPSAKDDELAAKTVDEIECLTKDKSFPELFRQFYKEISFDNVSATYHSLNALLSVVLMSDISAK